MILVTGGTGLVGSHLLLNLLKAGKNVRAIHRKTSDLNKVQQVFSYYIEKEEASKLFNKIEWFEANILNIPALTKAFKDVTTVYHCAAMVSFNPGDDKQLRKVNIEGTANVANLCIGKKIEKFCYVSSVAALGSSLNNNLITEKNYWNPEEDHSDYAISKYGAEIEVWRASQEGVPTIIVNPGIIIGPGFWHEGSGQIFTKIDKGLNYHFPKIAGFVGVEDVVKAMRQLMESPIFNESYILVSDNKSFKEILDSTATALEKPIPEKQLTTWILWIGWFFQKIGGFFGFKRQISKHTVNSLFSDSKYANEKIKTAIDFEFEPISAVIKNTASQYKQDQAG